MASWTKLARTGRPRINIGPCKNASCAKPARSRGWCHTHYWSWYCSQNPEKVRGYKRTYYEKNTDKCSAMSMAWQRRNPDKVREYTREGKRRYKHRKAAVPTIGFTREHLHAKVEYWGDKCWLCGDPWDHIDHVKPIARGGSHMLCNLRPACHSCNQKKKAAWPLEKVMERFVA